MNVLRYLIRRITGIVAAAALTLGFFLVLPLMQTISKPRPDELLVRSVDAANLPPPPPPIEEEPEKEPEPEEKPPELAEDAPPLDLSMLEMALNPGMSGDWMAGDFAVKLNMGSGAGGGDEVDALFSVSDLDQRPRAVHQPSPALDAKLRKKTAAAPGTVYIIFVVDERGKVENPIVQKSSDPVFEAPALAAVKQWRFEPGKRNGQTVRFRMRVPITFPKGQ